MNCDAKYIIYFSVELLPGKSLSRIRREQNLKYGLKRNLFYPDGRLKKRLGDKAKGNYTLKWLTKKIKNPLTLDQFLETRDVIRSCGQYQEEFRNNYVAFIDSYLYNRFMLLPHRNHFWLAVKGINLYENKFRSHSDGISTFFKVEPHIKIERIKKILLKHIKQQRHRPPK